MQMYTNRALVIRRNEETGDKEGSLRIETDTEKETVRLYKHQWGGKQEDSEVVLPQQFLPDLISALTNVQAFIVNES